MEKDKIMESYSKFKELLEEYERKGEHIPSFSQVCRIIGSDPYLLEKLIYLELGVRGDEIIASYNN